MAGNVVEERTRLVTSVCTGSAVLAAAGLLDGYRATTNNRAYQWATSHGSSAEWMARARWVEDRNRWTSSGTAAGMDMTANLVAYLVRERDRRDDHHRSGTRRSFVPGLGSIRGSSWTRMSWRCGRLAHWRKASYGTLTSVRTHIP